MNTNMTKLFIEKALYPMMESRKGNRVRQYYKELQASQHFDSQKLRELQRTRLETLLLTAVKSVPAYKNMLTETSIRDAPFSALQQIPVLKKNDFRTDPARYLNVDYPKNQLIPNKTGGSTGEPLSFYMDRYAVEHYEAARWRGLSWYGITFGSRSIMVWGNPLELDTAQQRKNRLKDHFLKNRTVIPAYALTEDKILEYIRLINRYQPEYIYGYASALDSFSQLVRRHKDKLTLTGLKAVVSTSETLYDSQRENIKAVFDHCAKNGNCPVVNEYGARDAGILAYSCPSDHLHITSENVIIEVIDPITQKPVAPGQSGMVVTTDLNNLAMPRLRWALGDRATLSPESGMCDCGCTLPLIRSLDGREDVMFKLPNGTLVHGHAVSQLTRKYKSIIQFQMIQTDLEHGILRIVHDHTAPHELPAYTQDVRDILSGVEIEVLEVDHLEPSASGKFRYTIRQFPL